MKLNQDYCAARQEYCKVIREVVDRLSQIMQEGFNQEFITSVII